MPSIFVREESSILPQFTRYKLEMILNGKIEKDEIWKMKEFGKSFLLDVN
jgi:hypothetical protein